MIHAGKLLVPEVPLLHLGYFSHIMKDGRAVVEIVRRPVQDPISIHLFSSLAHQGFVCPPVAADLPEHEPTKVSRE